MCPRDAGPYSFFKCPPHNVPHWFRSTFLVTAHTFAQCRQLAALHGFGLTECGDCLVEGVIMRSVGPEVASALHGRSAQSLTPAIAGARRTWLRHTHHPAARPPAVSRPEQAQHPDASGTHKLCLAVVSRDVMTEGAAVTITRRQPQPLGAAAARIRGRRHRERGTAMAQRNRTLAHRRGRGAAHRPRPAGAVAAVSAAVEQHAAASTAGNHR